MLVSDVSVPVAQDSDSVEKKPTPSRATISKALISPARTPPRSPLLNGHRDESPFPSGTYPAGRFANVYDSLVDGKLSASGSLSKKPSVGYDQDVTKKHMPKSGASGSSHHDGRSAPSNDPASRTQSQGAQRSLGVPQRRQQGRPPYSTPPVSYYSSSSAEGFQNPAPANPPPQPSSVPPSYATLGTTSYTQHGSYVGQYTMSPRPPPPSMYQPPYGYAHPSMHHPGMHSPEPTMQQQQSFSPIGFSSASLVPHMQPRRPGPMYPYQSYSPESRSSSSSSFATHGAPPSEISPPASYDHSSQSNSPQSAHPSSSFSNQHTPPFPRLQYPAMPTQYYSRESYPHSAPYQSQYPPSYALNQYMAPTSPEDGHVQGGTWWYIPPGASTAAPPPGSYDTSQQSYQGIYSVGYPQSRGPELDAYGNPITAGSGSTAYLPSPMSDSKSGAGYVTPSFAATLTASASQHSPSSGGSSVQEETSLSPLPPQAVGRSGSERAVVDSAPIRRHYHPNPPTQRSDWVMWVGNVPNDATHDELWRFFKQQNPPQPRAPLSSVSSSSSLSQPPHLPAGLISPEGSDFRGESINSSLGSDGVSSIFLIARSNCAFVNYLTEAHLLEAVRRFNGLQLRPGDSRCPRLVCRVRGKDDDLRAGVGGQRGTGIHTRWVKDRFVRGQESSADEHTDDPPTTPLTTTSDPGEHGVSSIVRTFSSDDEPRDAASRRSPQRHSSSSGSYASTTSSILARYFPKRYFILKSLTLFDLNLSVERGLWATQPHNEGILNQAYRTSNEVYLIFGVNKSGEFFGYAKMASPIGKIEEKVSWASRTNSSHSPTASLSSVAGRPRVTETIPEEKDASAASSRVEDEGKDTKGKARMILSPAEHRLAENSPQPVTRQEEAALRDAQDRGSRFRPKAPVPETNLPSAPAEMHDPHRRITLSTPKTFAETIDLHMFSSNQRAISLDPTAPDRARRRRGGVQNEGSDIPPDLSPLAEHLIRHPALTDLPQAQAVDDSSLAPEAQWGTTFRVQWIRVAKLPFHRTKHLRNPWNHDREVKVSRDGTELEPAVGQALLDEWDKPEPVTTPATPSSGSKRGLGGRSSLRIQERTEETQGHQGGNHE